MGDMCNLKFISQFQNAKYFVLHTNILLQYFSADANKNHRLTFIGKSCFT